VNRALVGLLLVLGAGSLAGQTVNDLVLMSEEFPPYNFEAGGVKQGTSIDLMERVLQLVGSKLTRNDITILPWARAYLALQADRNAVLFATTRTPAREALFQWVGPISAAKNVLIAPKSRRLKVRSVADLKGLTVGVIFDDAGQQLVEALGLPASQEELAPDADSDVRKLMAGRVDVIAYDENVTRWLLKENGANPNDYESVYVLAEGQHYFAFNRQVPDTVIRQMQAALDTLKKTGEYEKIQKKYLF
jgi:polar amino acid transport system substrate-binding protein